MRHSSLRLALAGLSILAVACGDEPAEVAGAGAQRAGAPEARARERAPEVVALRRALDLGRLAEARPLLREWRARLGTEGELLAARAAALAGDDLELSRCVEAARELDERDPRVYATAAELHAAAGRFETADQELRRGFEACGVGPELLRAQGVVFLCQPNGARQGLETIRKALERDPGLPFVDRALSQAHLLLGRQEIAASRAAPALAHAQEAVARDPADVEARRFLSDALAANAELGPAVAVLQELVDEGEPLEAELAMQCKRAAMGALLQRQRPQALELFRRARELGLSDEELGTGVTILREAAGEEVEAGIAAHTVADLPGARARFERALQLDPDSLAARNHLAVVLFKLEEFDAAAAHWGRVVEAAREEGLELPEPVHVNLAKALALAGREDEARAVVQAYLDREPEGRWAAESREALERLQ